MQEGIVVNSRILIESDMNAFHDYLIREEKSTATVEKYLRDVRAFLSLQSRNQ